MQEERSRRAWAILNRDLDADPALEMPVPAYLQTYEDLYLSTFEVGVPHPVCPLIESHWNKRHPVPKILHENILFYKQFVLELRPAVHNRRIICGSVEFLLYLTAGTGPGRRTGPRPPGRRPGAGIWAASAVKLPPAGFQRKQPGTWPSQWMNLLASALSARWSIRAVDYFAVVFPPYFSWIDFVMDWRTRNIILGATMYAMMDLNDLPILKSVVGASGENLADRSVPPRLRRACGCWSANIAAWIRDRPRGEGQ